MIQWFICTNDIVSGPFAAEEIIERVESREWSPQIKVWGKALQVWKPYQWWKENLEMILHEAQQKKDPRLWHYSFRGDSHGPLNRGELINLLKGLGGDANDALIWTQGMSQWAPIFEFHDIMDEVGVNRRHYPRAPAAGKIVILQGEQYAIGELKMISEGGFGAKNFSYDFAPGQILKCELIAEPFESSFFVMAQVRYLDSETVGFKFTQINREQQSLIISYVKEKNFEIMAGIKQAS